MIKSTHKAEVVPVILKEHGNADSLSIVDVFDGGYQVVVRTEEWLGVESAIYITPDTLVPLCEPEFAFLADVPGGRRYEIDDEGFSIRTKSKDAPYARVTVRRFRGVLSHGLLVPVPESIAGVGFVQRWDLHRYDPLPDVAGTGGDNERSPKGIIPVYDVDSLNRYANVFEEGELIIATEKIHGCNGRFAYAETADGDRKMFCGSRTQWKAETDVSLWWRALRNHPEISSICEANPDITVYGEVYGQVQKGFGYGVSGELRIAVFDVLYLGKWMDPVPARMQFPHLPWVPTIAGPGFPFNFDELKEIAEGPSAMPGAENIREGIVVEPLIGRTHPECGRVKLKLVSTNYLEGKRK